MKTRQIKLVTVLLLGALLLVGCAQSQQAPPQTGSNQTTTHPESISENNILKVRLYTDNDTVKLYTRFNLTLDIDNKGEPFEAFILYKFYGVNSTKAYSSTWDFENLSKGDLKREFGYPNLIPQPEGPYGEEGSYKYAVLVYDCSAIKKFGYTCYKQVELLYNNQSFFGDIEKDNNVTPAASGEITVRIEGVGPQECVQDSDCNKSKCENCATGSYICHNCTGFLTMTWGNGTEIRQCTEPNYFECVECLISKDCKEGFKCEEEKCVPDPYYCKSDSDCWPCEGCQNGKAVCTNKTCKYCDSQRQCKNGYVCRDWGCTSAEVLKSKKNCTSADTCFISTNVSGDPGVLCTFSTIPLENAKCLECTSDFYCKSGYHCYNYDCVPDNR